MRIHRRYSQRTFSPPYAVHYSPFLGLRQRGACDCRVRGSRYKITRDLSRVTCCRCEKTKVFRAAIETEFARVRHRNLRRLKRDMGQ